MSSSDDVASAGVLLGYLKAHNLLARASAVRIGQVLIEFDTPSHDKAPPPADKVQAELDQLDDEIMYASAGS